MTAISVLRRFIALACVAIAITTARAEYITGDAYIDLNARGQTSYDIEISASIVPGGEEECTAWVNYAGFYASSWGYMGEAGVMFYFQNVRLVNCQWVAEYVTKQVLWPDANGWDCYTYKDMPIPAAAWATGNASCSTYSNPLYIRIN